MKSERGNIVVYLVVGLVLFGLLLTGIWWVKSRAPKAVSTPQIAQTDNKKADDKPETTINQDEGGTTPTGASSSQNNDASTPAANNASDQATTGQSTPPSSDYPSQTSSTATTTPSAAPTRPESQTPNLTETGPVAASGPVEDSFMSALALGGAAYMSTAYARSRKMS